MNLPASDPSVRVTGIGSSDAAAVCGVSKYRTPLYVFYQKIGVIPSDDAAGEPAEWGSILEPVLLRQLAIRDRIHVVGRDEEGKPTLWTPSGSRERAIESVAEMLATLRHPDREWQYAHLDGITLDDNGDRTGFAEAKTGGYWTSPQWGEDTTRDIPTDYLVQIHHAALVCRAHGIPSVCRVPVLLGGQTWRRYIIEPDRRVLTMIAAREAEFWAHVENRQPPPATGRDLTTLARVYPEDDDTSIDVTLGLTFAARALQTARKLEAEAAFDADQAEAVIKAAMGKASVLEGRGWKITWRTTRPRRKVDWEAAFDAVAAIAQLKPAERDLFVKDYTTETPGSRRFLPTFNGEVKV